MIADVALPLPIDKVFSYAVPAVLAPFARPFLRVRVPFGSRSLVGCVLRVDEGAEEGLKAIQDLVDCVPLIDDTCFELCNWASRYYAAPIGLALKYALSLTTRTDKYRVVKTEDPSLVHLNNLTLKKACAVTGRIRILDYLNRSFIELSDIFTGNRLESGKRPVRADAHRATLFLGGARERLAFYTALISEELSHGRNVLMLLPDYQAAGAFFSRSLTESFPGAVFWYGSSLPEKKKAETYFRARAEGGRLILGNKSCVFLPLLDNGLVIIERPEEDGYRNEEAFRFNAVRLAVRRAEIAGVRAVLGSAAPPLEVLKWAAEGVVDVVEGRPIERPPVSSMRGDKNGGRRSYVPDAMICAIREVLDRRGTVVIHTPRKSYAASLSCAECGRPLPCPTCGAAGLSYHKAVEMVACNTCKGLFPYEERCSHCGSNSIIFFEVGAEYLEARMKEAFPDRTVFRVTGEAERLTDLRSLESGTGNIIVGTHILSKLYGLDTSQLILYGWEDLLRIGGYRAREKMFQVLANLIDALEPQELLLYTRGEALDLSPFLAPRQFYDDELARRRAAEFPPYVRLVSINVLKRSRQAGEKIVETIERLTQDARLDHQMLGPIRVKGRYGWRVILKGEGEAFSALLASLYRLPGVHVEADPLNV
jgi:primosomal protein N' (replication factor Y)